jgi:hypothetical protein
MARPTAIRVMISSRCSDRIQFMGREVPLSGVRLELKASLEAEPLLGSQIFDVWINEDAPPAEGSADSWENCMKQVRTADIVLVLFNGNAGWATETGEIGICFGELQTALTTAPSKTRLIKLPLVTLGTGAVRARNQRFRAFVEAQNLFRGAECTTGEDVIVRCKETLREAVAEMVRLGGREARRGKYDRGTALDWSRLSFQDRGEVMTKVLRSALIERDNAEEHGGNVFMKIAAHTILIVPSAIPAAMSVPSALEMANQPFLRDHRLARALTDKFVGPVHFIACHRSATEAQAARQLGFPDATIVSPPFGVYVADNVQKIQLVFISNCRDETSTREGVQRVFNWLEQTGEDRLFSDRAVSRSRIVRAIAKEASK